MIEIVGKEGITARLITHSVTGRLQPVYTYEAEYPRFVHSEVMTHKMFSKNAASSRAIPFAAILKLLREKPAMPVFWGKNQPGMQAKTELSPEQIEKAKAIWISAMEDIIHHSESLADYELHKQILNRLNEPWQRMKTVMSFTEDANFYWLRDHTDAQPEFRELAACMKAAKEQSTPRVLAHGQWHLPYVDYDESNNPLYDGKSIDIDTALKISASCCAQVSYRKLDDSLDKAMTIYEKLIESVPVHASPVEHQATPISFSTTPFNPSTWEPGITHVRRDGSLWSANFRGWIQYRQTLENHTAW